MTPLEKRVRRLESWNAFLLLVLVLGFIISGGYATLSSLTAQLNMLQIDEQANGDIAFWVSSDGPVVATHLVCVEPGGGPVAVATLPQPLAIVSSGGKTFSQGQVARLRWVDNRGDLLLELPHRRRFEALYYSPQIASQRAKERPSELSS